MLFLSRLLAAIRGVSNDPALEQRFSRLRTRPPEFVVHFVTKWLLLEGEEPGLYDLGWDQYKRIQDLYFQLDDPIMHDPDWVESESSGFFERMFGLQLPAQERYSTRDFGLALRLFRDCGTPRCPDEYDLPSELEGELGISVEQFMAMGFLSMYDVRASVDGVGVRGTLNLKSLERAHREGVFWCTPDAWEPFLKRVVCTPESFRACRSRKGYQVDDSTYLPFEFNPLMRFPLVDVGYGRFVAVDPDLIAMRVTWGLYFDLLEKRGKEFSDDFGDVFSRLVGELLSSVHPPELLWSDAEDEATAGGRSQANKPKRGDWAYKGKKYTVLFECKAMHPTLDLRQHGNRPAIQTVRGRMVSGLGQVVRQAEALQRGEWADKGLPPADVVCVLGVPIATEKKTTIFTGTDVQ